MIELFIGIMVVVLIYCMGEILFSDVRKSPYEESYEGLEEYIELIKGEEE